MDKEFDSGLRRSLARQGNGQQFPNVPLLLAAPAFTKVWVCASGHEMAGEEPFRLRLPFGNGAQELQSGPFCPVCAMDWLGATFRTWEKGKGSDASD